MRFALLVAGLLGVAAIALAASKTDEIRHWLGDATMPLREGLSRSSNIMVPMRDGVKLATDVYRPAWSDEPLPVIYIRTTYGGVSFEDIRQFVQHDYAVVVQDVRGRYDSEGHYESPYWTAGRDGYDTIDWIVSQPWSTDKVGTFGCSYLGESQIILAAENHPNHIAMIAAGAGGGIGKAQDAYGYFGVFENGVLNLASALGWFTAEGAKDFKVTPRPPDYETNMRQNMDHLPVSNLAKQMVPFQTGFDDLLKHPLTDKWWDKQGYISPDDEFSVATLHINDWFDQTAQNSFLLARDMAEQAKTTRAKSQYVLIAPGLHCGHELLKSGQVTVGDMRFDYTAKDFRQIYLDWFDHWLKDKPTALPPKFEYFAIHSGQWRTSEQWPPASTRQQRYYLSSGNRLDSQSAITSNRSGAFDEYTYNPRDPVPTLGGPICCTYRAEDRPGPIDQTPLDNRADVLVYQTTPLAEAVELEGNAKAVLFVATDAPDTDFTVKLVDHYPDGRAFNLQDGVVRLRYRNGIDQPALAVPGQIYRIELTLRPIAYRFNTGHRIEVRISSSNFPRLVRNLNTGGDEYNDDRIRVAKNRVYFTGDTASYIELPVAPLK